MSLIEMLWKIKSSYHRAKYFVQVEHTANNVKSRNEYKSKLQGLKDIHKGKRCFVIGNGPSLTAKDLDLIKGEYTFASNRIFYMFDKTEWRPTYYCAQDTDVIEDIAKNFNLIKKNCQGMFLINTCQPLLDSEFLDDPSVYLFYARFTAAHRNRKFSNDISKFIDGGSTITYAMLQIAAYMGFKEIYLIGVDHNYASTTFKDGKISAEEVKKNYFEGMPSDIVMTKPNTNISTISFEEAKRFALGNALIIKNATRGGHLEVFERVDLDLLF